MALPSLYDAISLAYKYYPNPEPVEIVARRNGFEYRDRLEFAQRGDVKFGRHELAGRKVLADGLLWNIPATLLVTVPDILPGDLVIGETNVVGNTPVDTWMVEESELGNLETEWRLKTVRLRFGDKVDLLAPQVSKDSDTGAAVERFVSVRMDLTCWVQPVIPREKIELGQEYTVASHFVWFPANPAENSIVPLSTQHVLKFGERLLAVRARAMNVDELDMLWVAPCLEND
jgi:hypothetical protein